MARRPVIPTIKAGEGAPQTEEPSFVGEVTSTQRLPANQQEDVTPTVNWLGSSYSGADIKIVAHLYGSVDRWKRIEDLEQEAAQVGDAIIALDRLSAFPIDNPEEASARFPDRTTFITTGGLTVDHPQVSAISPFYIPFITEPSRTKRAMYNQAIILKTLQEGYQSQIEGLRKVLEASSSTYTLGSLQTISIQSHREKYPVRALGTSYVKGYTRGPRTLAGSMIFTVFDEHALRGLIRQSSVLLDRYELEFDTTSILPDQLPPIDLTIAFANEYGSLSKMSLYGVEFMNDGVTFSIEDLLSENVLSFVARDVDIMTKLGQVKLSEFERGMFTSSIDGTSKDLLASELQFTTQDAYAEYVNRLGVRRRFKNR